MARTPATSSVAQPFLAQTPAPPRPAEQQWSVSPGAVIAWMMVNGAFIGVGLSQVPLAAGYAAGSTLLPELMIACHIGFAALLAPLLSRSIATLLIVILASWPGLLLAGGLASRPIVDILLAGMVITAWLLALYVWTNCFRSVAGRQVVVAVACLLAVGVPLLSYLTAEFGLNDEGARSGAFALLAPMILSWQLAAGGDVSWTSALPLALCLMLGVAIHVARSSSPKVANSAAV